MVAGDPLSTSLQFELSRIEEDLSRCSLCNGIGTSYLIRITKNSAFIGIILTCDDCASRMKDEVDTSNPV